MNENAFLKLLPNSRILFLIFISFLAYYLAARLGLEIATINKQASPVWPATGIGISLILLFGPRMAIGIFAGAVLSNFETGLNLPSVIAIATGNTLESIFFCFAFSRLSSRETFDVHSRVVFGMFLLILAACISASVGTLSLWITSVIPLQLIAKNWITWWIGDLLGALLIVPIAYKIKLAVFDSGKTSLLKIGKLFAVAILTVIVCRFIFISETGKPFLFLIFLPLLIAAIWFNSIWVYLLSLSVSAFSVWQTILGHGPFVDISINDSLVHLQIFLAGTSITAIGLGSLKQNGIHYRTAMALVFGWMLSGGTFYFSYTGAATKDESHFQTKIKSSKDAIESRMSDYIQMLESGASFINASDYVSKYEWHLFANKLLSTNKYPGIEGVGLIISGSLKKRIRKSDFYLSKYQPNTKSHNIPNLNDLEIIHSTEDDFVVTYIEPFEPNKKAIGLNISSEKQRYEAALAARDSGVPTMTSAVKLAYDSQNRFGFLVYLPIYKRDAPIDTIENRRSAFVGFIYAPVVFDKFIKSAILPFENELNIKISETGNLNKLVYSSNDSKASSNETVKKDVVLAGKVFNLNWEKGYKFESSASLVSSWIGFFGTLASLFLAVMLSSVQNLKVKAQKIAEEITEELRTQKRSWQALTETSPIGIFLTDKNGLCNYVNPAWQRMTGLSSEDAFGNGWTKIIHPDDLEEIGRNWTQLINGGSFSCNYRFLKPDKKLVYVTGQAQPLLDDNQKITGYFGTVQDITELHLNQIAATTSSRMSSLGQMASGIAHEINNPLTIIQGRALYIEKIFDTNGAVDKLKIKQSVDQINSTVQRIAKIVTGLQLFSRDPSIEQFQKVSLKDVLQSTLGLCRERFLNNNTQLIAPVESELDFIFWGRPEQITQVFLNILNNAFDATQTMNDRWVKIEITPSSTKDKFYVLFSDSGPGVPKENQEKIFDPFFTTKDVGSGTGLGLSISKGIMNKHNGQIAIDDSKLRTTFIVELPLLREQSDAGVA